MSQSGFSMAMGVARDMILSRRRPVSVFRRDLAGKTVVFTGGTDGMGRVAAMRLVEMGATIRLAGRNPGKTAEAVAALNEIAGAERAFAVDCDLASLASVRACAAELLEACPRIDLLVNCAGINTRRRMLSPDGNELNWAVNFLGAQVLTALLLERIRASAPARVVNVSSAMVRAGRIDFDDLQMTRDWTSGKAYAQAKLATNAATLALARQLEGAGVTAHALNPGFIRTALLRDFRGPMRIWQWIMNWMASPPEVGAERIVRVALSPEYEAVSGQFIDEDTVCPPGSYVPDDESIARLWALVEQTAAA
ncbi:MAG: SDR family NAD(P)-dependent oxidoreductase [Gammaproteobacteria bacterium]|nr:SDR family NAD(P)-dependent oxidoreductase [Gammaproteobacteria bacterium]